MKQQRECLVYRADFLPRQPQAGAGANLNYRRPELAIETRQLGDLGDHCLRVDVVCVGICGTDIHMMQTAPDGYVKSSAPASVPAGGRILGHEGVGRVREVGAAVTRFQPGDWVAFESIRTCQTCPPCRRGQFNQCEQAALIGMQEDGLFASCADLPAQLAHDVSDMISCHPRGLHAAACLEPAGVAWTACSKAGIGGDDRVLVIGAGPIGIFCAMLSRLIFGAARVTIVDPVSFRRDLAASWCDQVCASTRDVLESDLRHDVIIEASGDLSDLGRLIRQVDANGRIILLARSGEDLSIDAVDHMITHGISIAGVRGHLGGALDRLIRLYVAGRLPLHALVTGEVNSLAALREVLLEPGPILRDNCKVMFNPHPE